MNPGQFSHEVFVSVRAPAGTSVRPSSSGFASQIGDTSAAAINLLCLAGERRKCRDQLRVRTSLGWHIRYSSIEKRCYLHTAGSSSTLWMLICEDLETLWHTHAIFHNADRVADQLFGNAKMVDGMIVWVIRACHLCWAERPSDVTIFLPSFFLHVSACVNIMFLCSVIDSFPALPDRVDKRKPRHPAM